MPFFKKKDKAVQSQPPTRPPPANSGPDLREASSNSTFGDGRDNNDRDSNLSSADTRVNQQRDSNGNRQTVVTTTTTTTTTTVTSDGRVITEQHQRPASELPTDRSPRPRSPDNQAPQIPVQPSTTSTPGIPNRDARRGSHGEPIASSNLSQPAPPMPYQHNNAQPAQPNNAPSSLNFSRPGGHRENIKQAALGLNGAAESLRGAINTRAGELLRDDPETLAKNREVRDKGMRDLRGSTLMQRKVVGQHEDDRKKTLKRRSGIFGPAEDRSINF